VVNLLYTMSGKPYQLSYSTQEDHRGILLVASYCGLQDQLGATQAWSDIQLTTSDGQQLSTFTSICRYLSSQSSKSQQLLGATPLDRATVRQFAPEACMSYSASQANAFTEVACTVRQRIIVSSGARLALLP